jgi:hypothetical protein
MSEAIEVAVVAELSDLSYAPDSMGEAGRVERSQCEAQGPLPGPSPLIRAEAWWPSDTRVRAVREHYQRMRLGVEFWTGRGDEGEADRCRRAMVWAEEQLGLR